MKCLLITTHEPVRFFKQDGSSVSVELDYVTTKTLKTLSCTGELYTHIKACNLSVIDATWMVSNVTDAIKTLDTHGIYPFESKEAAKIFARNKKLTGFKYLKLPSYY